MDVRKADLGRLSAIAAGAYGCVYRTAGHRLPGEDQELAYKEFTTQHAEQTRAASAAVNLWSHLDPDDRLHFGKLSTWPRALVRDSRGSVCGLLMPLLDDEFFYQRPDAINGGFKRRPLEMSWLMAGEGQRRAAGVDAEADRIDRHMLLAQLAYGLALLHRLGWVYGDLSFKNVAFALAPPRIKLLDCDGAARVSDTSRRQAHTPHWAPPECKANKSRLQDPTTDVYKLGLAVLRCLTPGAGAASTQDPARIAGALDDEGEHLVAQALSSEPRDRPTAKEVFLYFKRILQGRITLPAVHAAQLLTPVRLRGQDAQVEYQVEHADEVVVEAGNGQRVKVDPTGGHKTIAFRPDATGPVTLRARNRFGTALVRLGTVDLYELPPFDIGKVTLPRPDVPGLGAVGLPNLASSVLPDRPVTGIGTPAMVVSSPDVVGLLDVVIPHPTAVPALPRIDGPVAEAAGQIRASVLDATMEIASAIRAATARASARLTHERWST